MAFCCSLLRIESMCSLSSPCQLTSSAPGLIEHTGRSVCGVNAKLTSARSAISRQADPPIESPSSTVAPYPSDPRRTSSR